MLGTKALMAAASSARRGGRRVDPSEAISLSARVKIKSPLISKTKIAASGRSSSGRITIFHRGGGSKRLLRKVDMKRNTSSMGIVESIQYDPNRSSRIAAVRWVEGVQRRGQKKPNNVVEGFTPVRKLVEPATTTIRGQFSLYSMSGKVVQRKMDCLAPGLAANSVVVGVPGTVPTTVPHWLLKSGFGSQKTSVKDVFYSAFSSQKAKGETRACFGGSIGLPRIAVVGAKPGFISTRMREELRGKEAASVFEVRKWTPQSIVWEHRSKRKGAISWQNCRTQGSLGLVGAAEIA